MTELIMVFASLSLLWSCTTDVHAVWHIYYAVNQFSMWLQLLIFEYLPSVCCKLVFFFFSAAACSYRPGEKVMNNLMWCHDRRKAQNEPIERSKDWDLRTKVTINVYWHSTWWWLQLNIRSGEGLTGHQCTLYLTKQSINLNR